MSVRLRDTFYAQWAVTLGFMSRKLTAHELSRIINQYALFRNSVFYIPRVQEYYLSR